MQPKLSVASSRFGSFQLMGTIERDIIKHPMQINNKKVGWPNLTILDPLFLRVHIKKNILVTEAIVPKVKPIILTGFEIDMILLLSGGMARGGVVVEEE